MKAYIPLLSLVILQLCVASCNKDDKNEHICCSSDPVVFTIDSQTYLIPNVITPNGDGINDKFCIAGPNNLHIKSIIIEAINTEDTPDNYRMVCREIYLPPDNVSHARGPGPFGSFRYEMELEHPSGTTRIVSGRFCSADCEDLKSADWQNCTFSTQFNPLLGFDVDKPSGESCP